MFVNLVLSIVFGVFVLQAVMKDLDPTLPIACVWQVPSHSAASNAAISIAGTIGVIAGQCIVFILGVWYLHSKRRAWLKWIQAAGILFLFAIAVGAAIRVILLSQAFGTPSVPLNDTGERDWGFGQLLSMLLLLLPLISAIEIYRGTLSWNPCSQMRLPCPSFTKRIAIRQIQINIDKFLAMSIQNIARNISISV